MNQQIEKEEKETAQLFNTRKRIALIFIIKTFKTFITKCMQNSNSEEEQIKNYKKLTILNVLFPTSTLPFQSCN